MLKLGKKEARHDSRTLQMATYVKSGVVAPPSVDYSTRATSYPMMMNDSLGDCTIAAVGHMIEAWTKGGIILPDSLVETDYSAVSGYVPGDESTDNGAVELDVLNLWRKNGMGMGSKIEAYSAVEPLNTAHTKLGIYLFGGLYVGLALPMSAQNQVGKIWTAVRGSHGEPGSWGRHAVPILAYDKYGLLCVTWGQLQWMTWGFYHKCSDESYALLSPDWTSNESWIDTESLQSDLAIVTS